MVWTWMGLRFRRAWFDLVDLECVVVCSGVMN